MSSKERFFRQLEHKSVDQISVTEHFWELTQSTWTEQGFMKEGENIDDHFNFDIERSWCFNSEADYQAEKIILEEDEDTKLVLNGNFAKLRFHKKHASTPEHVGFEIQTYEDYIEKIKPLAVPAEGRINFEAYNNIKARCQKNERAFGWAGLSVFEMMHGVVGHENMLMSMALEPEWIKDMAMTSADQIIGTLEILFEKSGKPDFIWVYDDLGFRGRPFMSPEMYKEIVMPAHKKIADFVHGYGLKIVFHTCGFVEPLLPIMVENNVLDCLQAMEVKAGMDLLRIYKNYGEKIALMGGLDVRPIIANDKEAMRKMLETHIPIVKKNNGYILHSDHSIPENAAYEGYKYFLDLGRELGKY